MRKLRLRDGSRHGSGNHLNRTNANSVHKGEDAAAGGAGAMVTNYPDSIASPDHNLRGTTEDGNMDGFGGRMMDRLRQVMCGLHGHDTLLHYSKDRMSL